jgi:hypothetical protein
MLYFYLGRNALTTPLRQPSLQEIGRRNLRHAELYEVWALGGQGLYKNFLHMECLYQNLVGGPGHMTDPALNQYNLSTEHHHECQPLDHNTVPTLSRRTLDREP